MKILVTTGIFPPDVGGPAKFVPLIANKLSKENKLKVITLSKENVVDSHSDYEILRILRNQNKITRFMKTIVLIIKKTNSNSKIIYKSHAEVFGNAFEDPKRRTPGIDKIIKFTGMKPTKNIEFMIESIINFKKNN